MFFCRHPDAVVEAFRADVSYMSGKRTGSVCDPLTNSAQWSRRFIGLKLFLSLAQSGEDGYVAMVEHQTHMGHVLRESLVNSGWRIVNHTPLPLVCFTRDGINVANFLTSLRERQIAWMSEAEIDGTPVVRACVTSFRTKEDDIHWVVGEMNRIIAENAESASGPAETVLMGGIGQPETGSHLADLSRSMRNGRIK